ncbi:hypothetical protein QQS21_004906 [Conoideocrella luteorostrata]|uniref:Uncharacterized protein n=1 Tax=Conoideocrella luteorostrata TaxID=1105319 RepID=A0AAJ0CT62_9HYPO|nr:hypothetical protein QQS21_004906 [Conoideocrella luteorostrata]
MKHHYVSSLMFAALAVAASSPGKTEHQQPQRGGHPRLNSKSDHGTVGSDVADLLRSDSHNVGKEGPRRNDVEVDSSKESQVPGHLAYVPWDIENVPESGLKDIIFPMSMRDSIHQEGWYFAQDFFFGGTPGALAYIGLQPRRDNTSGPVIHAAFSSFAKGTKANDPNCKDGADGGPGVSCAVDIIGDYTHLHDLKVNNTGGTTWSGTLIDTLTKHETHIGSWTLPAHNTGLKGPWVGFVEWWPFNNPGGKDPACHQLNKTSVLFGIPRTSSSGAGPGNLGDAYEVSKCKGKQNFHSRRVGDSVEVTVGFNKLALEGH